MMNLLRSLLGGANESLVEAIRAGALIIDVRSTAEFRGGHVAGSKNIPLGEIQNNPSVLPNGKPIVFCCASGARSGAATSIAKSRGLDAYNGGPWTSVNKVVADLSEAAR